MDISSMQVDIRDIVESCGESLPISQKDAGKELDLLEATVITALYDWRKNIRRKAVYAAWERYRGFLRGGFVADHEVMVVLQDDEGKCWSAYLCEAPIEYLSRAAGRAYPFRIEEA